MLAFRLYNTNYKNTSVGREKLLHIMTCSIELPVGMKYHLRLYLFPIDRTYR